MVEQNGIVNTLFLRVAARRNDKENVIGGLRGATRIWICHESPDLHHWDNLSDCLEKNNRRKEESKVTSHIEANMHHRKQGEKINEVIKARLTDTEVVVSASTTEKSVAEFSLETKNSMSMSRKCVMNLDKTSRYKTDFIRSKDSKAIYLLLQLVNVTKSNQLQWIKISYILPISSEILCSYSSKTTRMRWERENHLSRFYINLISSTKPVFIPRSRILFLFNQTT